MKNNIWGQGSQTLKKEPLNMTAASETRVCKWPEIGLLSCKPGHLDIESPDLTTSVEA